VKELLDGVDVEGLVRVHSFNDPNQNPGVIVHSITRDFFPERALRLFISYSRHDQRYLERFRTDLVLYERKGEQLIRLGNRAISEATNRDRAWKAVTRSG
jgi:hypothetical protein